MATDSVHEIPSLHSDDDIEKQKTSNDAVKATKKSSKKESGVPGPLADSVTGYPRLAERMGLMPPTMMFRRFGALNARNLLYLQSDLIYLESELRLVEEQDSKSANTRKRNYAVCSYLVTTSNRRQEDGTLRDGDTKQRDLILKIRETLKEYNDAIIQQETILNMKDPDPYDILNVQAFLSSDAMGPDCLRGDDRYTWGDAHVPNSHHKELIVLKARQQFDSFSQFVAARAIKVVAKLGDWGCKPLKKPDPVIGEVSLRDDVVFKATFWLTSMIACILPVLSIMVLTNLSNPDAKLGTIAAFNILIGVCLLVFTDARRIDVFAVTAAFTAVQVVFLSQTLSGPVEIFVAKPLEVFLADSNARTKESSMCPC